MSYIPYRHIELYKLILGVYKQCFINKYMIQKNIQIKEDQDEFLKEQKLSFNFSKFVRDKLYEYINFKKEVENDKRNETIK